MRDETDRNNPPAQRTLRSLEITVRDSGTGKTFGYTHKTDRIYFDFDKAKIDIVEKLDVIIGKMKESA